MIELARAFARVYVVARSSAKPVSISYAGGEGARCAGTNGQTLFEFPSTGVLASAGITYTVWSFSPDDG